MGCGLATYNQELCGQGLGAVDWLTPRWFISCTNLPDINDQNPSTHTHLSGIEDLCAKRDDLHRQILQEEEEKQKIQNDIRILTERLAQVTTSPLTHTHTHTLPCAHAAQTHEPKYMYTVTDTIKYCSSTFNLR